MSFEYILSTKNRPMLVHDKSIYTRESTSKGGVTYWKCKENRNMGCRARIHTKDEAIISIIGEHTCLVNPSKIEKIIVINRLKIDTKESHEKPKNLICGLLNNVSREILAELPSKSSMTRQIHRQRSIASPQFPRYSSPEDLYIPDEAVMLASGENSLLHDSGMNKNRILIFSTEENLKFLGMCRE